jgi:putative endonuclease
MTPITQPWFVYILLCKNGSYYVGVATDVDDRVKEHNTGQGSKFTRDRTPVKLVYTEEYEDYKSARKREVQLKGWRREKKEWLINGFPSTRPWDSLRAIGESQSLRHCRRQWPEPVEGPEVKLD